MWKNNRCKHPFINTRLVRRGCGCKWTWETIQHYTYIQNKVNEQHFYCCSTFHCKSLDECNNNYILVLSFQKRRINEKKTRDSTLHPCFNSLLTYNYYILRQRLQYFYQCRVHLLLLLLKLQYQHTDYSENKSQWVYLTGMILDRK